MKTRKEKSMRWTPEAIKNLRKKFGERQEDFCLRVGISVGALRDWEQGRSVPIGPARLLLDRLDEDLKELVSA